MALNLRNLRETIQAIIGDSTAKFAVHIDRAINSSGRDLVKVSDWAETEEQEIGLTVAPYETGTVTVTNGSTTVTGSGTTFTSGMAGRRFSLGYTSPFYEIEAYVSATEITLADAYAEDTAAGEEYVVYQDRYSLASDCRKITKLRVQKVGNTAPRSVNQRAMDRLAYLPRGTGAPRFWCTDGVDSSGYTRILLRPVPDSVMRVHYRYLKQWTELVKDTDLAILNEDRRDLLIERALWRCYTLKRETAEAAAHLSVYDKLVSEETADGTQAEEEMGRMATFDSHPEDAPIITINQPTDGY